METFAKTKIRIKICGLKREQDIDYVNEALPDFIGFVFAPKSKRYVDFCEAKKLKSLLDKRIKAVGVFTNETIENIQEACEEKIIDIVQLHADEDENYVKVLKSKIDKLNIPIIKAIKAISKEYILQQMDRFKDVDFFLIDSFSKSENSFGGLGEAFNWESVLPKIDKPFFLAGGIGLENMNKAIKQVNPYSLDLSSCVETNGFKDRQKILDILKNKEKLKEEEKENREKIMDNTKFGIYGGQYIPEILMNEIIALEKAYNHYKNDEKFLKELRDLQLNYAGRPSLLYYAKNMTEDLGGAKIYLKREDLNHTGSHKINNVLGQVLLAKYMGKTRVIAETGAGQHGVATATAAALLGLECEIFMGKEDTERQALNVYRMELLGAKVNPVTSGTMTLKDAVNETMRHWSTRADDTLYVLGSVMGPHPFPTIVRDFQSIIGKEVKEQILKIENKLPTLVTACVGGGSNAMGLFYEFIGDKDVDLVGCEAAGWGVETEKHAASISKGTLGIFHGMKSIFCQDKDGQIAPVYSISAGLDYPGIGPEHAYLHSIGRAKYVPITDDEAVDAFEYLSKQEGIIPAIESSHAVAYVRKIAKSMKKDDIIVICLSGRGDKDVAAIAKYRGNQIDE